LENDFSNVATCGSAAKKNEQRQEKIQTHIYVDICRSYIFENFA